MNIHSVNYISLFSNTSNILPALSSHMRFDEFPEGSGPAGGFRAAAKYFHHAKAFHDRHFFLAHPLLYRVFLASKDKEKQIVPLAEAFQSSDQGQAPAVLLERGTHGQDDVRLRVRVFVFQQIEEALVIFVVGHPANGEAGSVDQDAPGQGAPAQCGQGLGLSHTPMADNNKCLALFQRFGLHPSQQDTSRRRRLARAGALVSGPGVQCPFSLLIRWRNHGKVKNALVLATSSRPGGRNLFFENQESVAWAGAGWKSPSLTMIRPTPIR